MATIFDFDEINALAEYSYDVRDTVEEVKDDIADILISAYLFGVHKGNEEIEMDVEPDVDRIYDALYLVVNGKTFEERIEDYYNEGDVTGISRVAVTEAHRMVNTGVSLVGESGVAVGKSVFKTWITMGDEKVRDTHSYLEGMTIPYEQKFYTYDGDSAMFCGGFSSASNNVNCRCVIELSV